MWHTLFDSLPVELMYEKFQEYWTIFGSQPKSKFQKKLAQAWVGTKKSRLKKQQAWQTLFGEYDLEDIVLEINRIWIDSEFQLVIGIERIQKVKLMTKN